MNKNSERFTTFIHTERGIAQFIVILAGALVVILAIGFFAFKNGQIKTFPVNIETDSPTFKFSLENWQTIELANGYFKFLLPSQIVAGDKIDDNLQNDGYRISIHTDFYPNQSLAEKAKSCYTQEKFGYNESFYKLCERDWVIRLFLTRERKDRSSALDNLLSFNRTGPYFISSDLQKYVDTNNRNWEIFNTAGYVYSYGTKNNNPRNIIDIIYSTSAFYITNDYRYELTISTPATYLGESILERDNPKSLYFSVMQNQLVEKVLDNFEFNLKEEIILPFVKYNNNDLNISLNYPSYLILNNTNCSITLTPPEKREKSEPEVFKYISYPCPIESNQLIQNVFNISDKIGALSFGETILLLDESPDINIFNTYTRTNDISVAGSQAVVLENDNVWEYDGLHKILLLRFNGKKYIIEGFYRTPDDFNKILSTFKFLD